MLEVALAFTGGLVAIVAMAMVCEQYMFRKMPWWKSGLAIAAIILIMYPSDLSHIAAFAIAAFVLITEYLAQPNRTLSWKRGSTP
jgi:TRAP-type uncharacterized transport system fused permease subunit